MLELETVGTKSGARRHNVLGVFPDTSDGQAADESASADSWLVVFDGTVGSDP